MSRDLTLAGHLARRWWLSEDAAKHRLATFAPCSLNPVHRVSLLEGYLCDPRPDDPPGPKLLCFACVTTQDYATWTGWPEQTAALKSASKEPSLLRSLLLTACIAAGLALGAALDQFIPSPTEESQINLLGGNRNQQKTLAASGLDTMIVMGFTGYFFGAGLAGTFALWRSRAKTRFREGKLIGFVRWLASVTLFVLIVPAAISLASRVAAEIMRHVPELPAFWRSLLTYLLLSSIVVAHIPLFLGSHHIGRRLRGKRSTAKSPDGESSTNV